MTSARATPERNAGERSVGERNAGERTAYVNARLLDPATRLDTVGGLLVEGKRIVDFGPNILAAGVPEGATVVDCGGHCLAPGLVDIRVQLREPGEEHKETMATACQAAVAGGVTTMVCLPNTDPAIDNVAVVEFIARRAREIGTVRIFAYASITKKLAGRELTEMGLLARDGAVAFTDGEVTVADALVMRRALSYARTHNLLIVQHPEEPSLARGGSMNEGEVATRLGLAGIPAVAETIMVERDIRLVELTGGRYHAAHLSTAGAIDAVRKARARGLAVSCDTAPPYFALDEAAVGDYRTFAKLSPPLRGEADRQAVIEGLKDGTIEIVASDHAPHDQDSKRIPFALAETGAVGVETLLPITLELYHQGHLALLDALTALTSGPASLLRLPGGRLEKDGPADIVIFDLNRAWTIDADNLRSKSKNSPFDARPVQGKVLRTVIAGRTVFSTED